MLKRLTRCLCGLLIFGSLYSARAEEARPAGSPNVRDARPGPPDKPPIRMLDQTLMLGGAGGNQSLGAAGRWSQVRDAITAEFHPSAALITTEAKPQAVAKQLTQGAKMRSGPPSMVTAVVEPTGDLNSVGQADAARAAYERPVNVRKVELAAVIEGDGRLSAVDVTMPSGSSAFDDVAVAAVRHAFQNRPPADADDQPSSGPPRRLIAHMRVTAGRAVVLPRVVPAREPIAANVRMPTQGVVGTNSGQFDETTGYVHVDRPFGDRITTQVELISVSPAPPPRTPASTPPAAPRKAE